MTFLLELVLCEKWRASLCKLLRLSDLDGRESRLADYSACTVMRTKE